MELCWNYIKAGYECHYSYYSGKITITCRLWTSWHFDDKIAQKYLLEAISAPLVPSYVFYDKEDALTWINEVEFPKVFKLKGGAGSQNVSLIKTRKQAIRMAKKAFGRGFPQFNRIQYLKERIRRVKEGKDSYLGILKGLGKLKSASPKPINSCTKSLERTTQ